MKNALAATVFCCALLFDVSAGSALEPWEAYQKTYQAQSEKDQAQQPPKPNYFEQFQTKKNQAQPARKPNVYEQFGDNPSNLPNRYSIYSSALGIAGANLQTMILLDHQTGRTWMLFMPQGQRGWTWSPLPYVGGAPK